MFPRLLLTSQTIWLVIFFYWPVIQILAEAFLFSFCLSNFLEPRVISVSIGIIYTMPSNVQCLEQGKGHNYETM
jgi:hypothetical protein